MKKDEKYVKHILTTLNRYANIFSGRNHISFPKAFSVLYLSPFLVHLPPSSEPLSSYGTEYIRLSYASFLRSPRCRRLHRRQPTKIQPRPFSFGAFLSKMREYVSRRAPFFWFFRVIFRSSCIVRSSFFR